MKKGFLMFLVIGLICMLTFCAAYAVEENQCFQWNGRQLRILEVLDGEAVTPISDQPADGRYVQLVINCEGEQLTWSLQRDIPAVLRDPAGVEHTAGSISGSFSESVSLDEINNAKMKPQFTLEFDLPEDIILSDCFLEIDGAEQNPDIPDELIGAWNGTGSPHNGGSPIELDVLVNADGSGEYTFKQSGYVESYPFNLSSFDNTFSVTIPEGNYLGITECGGTYTFDGEELSLDITTRFDSGRTFSYTAVCTKKNVSGTETPPESVADPVEPSTQPVVPKIQPVVPKIQPVIPKIQPVIP